MTFSKPSAPPNHHRRVYGDGTRGLEVELAELESTWSIAMPDNYEELYIEWRPEEKVVELFSQTEETVYATTAVNIRSSYSTDSEKLGQLTTAQSVTRIGVGNAGTEAEGWSKVLLDGKEVYVSSKYLSLTKPAPPSKPPQQSKPSQGDGTGDKGQQPQQSQGEQCGGVPEEEWTVPMGRPGEPLLTLTPEEVEAAKEAGWEAERNSGINWNG